jgi:hypothetical protein
VKAGDEIMATVYDGDMVLYNVMIMPKTAGEKVSVFNPSREASSPRCGLVSVRFKCSEPGF